MTGVLVTDASVVVDLLGQFEAEPIANLMLAGNVSLCAPELLDVEVLHTFRRLDALGKISRRSRTGIVRDLNFLPIKRYRHDNLREDIWSLRKNLTAYDATYVALARQLGAVLVTRDRKLARTPRLGVRVVTP